MQVKFDSDMKIFAQIGDPLEHSCTSYIHNSMYALGNVNAVNFNVVVKRGELPQFAEAAKVMHLSGFGITMPQKTDIIPLLDECDEFSRIFNSVNHVKIENGRLIGRVWMAWECVLNVPQEIVAKVAKKIDCFICDLKTVNPEKHRLGTGKGNDVILKNIMYLAKNHRDVLVRTPIIPDFNDTVDDMREHAAYLSRLGEKVKVELLPFHGICEKKRGPSFVRSIAPNNGSCTAACRGGGRRCRRKAPTAHSGFETTRGDANDAETPDCGLQGHYQQRGWGRGGRVGKGRKGEIQPLRAVRTLGDRRDVQRRRPRVCRLCSVGEPAAFSSC